MRQRPGFGVLTIGAAAGAVALVLVLSLVRADWDEEPAEPSTAISVPPVASSPGAAPREPPAASSEAPAAGPTPEADAAIKAAGDSQGASATAASRTKADPAPPDATPASLLESRQAFEWQSPPHPLASATSSNSPGGAGPSREQVPGPGSLQSSPALPQSPPASSPAAAGPATPGSTAKPQAVGDVSSLEDRPAVAAGEIRVFIHHAANSHGDAALAQQVADHLRRQGFIVADIRPVDFIIGKPSVRYFFDDDRSASERLVDELSRFFEETGSRAPDQASDFTHFEPKPRPGNVEVWLPAS